MDRDLVELWLCINKCLAQGRDPGRYVEELFVLRNYDEEARERVFALIDHKTPEQAERDALAAIRTLRCAW